VLIITDKQAVGVGRECSLASTRETEEEGNIASVLSNICGRVQGQLAEFDRLEIVLKWQFSMLK